MIASGKSAAEVMQAMGIQQVDQAELVAFCRELLAADPNVVAQIKAGKQKAVGSLVGQAKRKNPNVNPSQVQQICLDLWKRTSSRPPCPSSR